MMSKLSLLALLILGILTKDALCQYGPMLNNVSMIVNATMANGMAGNPALSFLANSVAHDQHVSPDMLQHVDIASIVHLYDQYSHDYLANHCDKAEYYLELLISLGHTPYHDLLTLNRIAPLLACSKDCHFMPLFETNLTDHYNMSLFLARHLPHKLAKMCSIGLSKMMGMQNHTHDNNTHDVDMMIDLIKLHPNINFGAVFSPVSIRRLPPMDVMHLIGNLTAQTEMTSDMTKELGRFVPRNASLAAYKKIASGIPIDIFEGASLSDLLSCLTTCDLHNFDLTRIARLVSLILKKDHSASTLRALLGTNSSEVLSSIPDDILSSMDLTNMDPSHLPHRAQRMMANHVLQSMHLADIHDSTVIQQILSVLPVSIINNVTGHDTIETYGRLLAANRNSSSDLLSSTQRGMMLENLLEHIVNETGSHSTPDLVSHLNATHVEELAELFFEANETVISNLALNKHLFDELISELAEIPEAKCVDYKFKSRSLLARYAISALAQNPSSPTESDLDMLGPCLASALPATIISSISPMVLHNRIIYFTDGKFQPDAQTAQAFSSKLGSIFQLDVVKADPASFLSDLGDSIVFFPNVGMLDDAILASYGSQWLEHAKETRNPSNQKVQEYRLGVPDTSSMNMLFMGAQSAIIHSIKSHALDQLNHMTAHRRRRSAAPTSPPFTCDDCSDGHVCLTQYENSVCHFSLDDLSSLSNDDMMACLSILGSSSDCTQKNLTDIAHLVVNRLFNNSVSHIPDHNIQDMNHLVQGLQADQISMLDIESMETISVLGQLSNMTNDQLHSVMMPLRQFFGGSFDAAALTLMGNMACGLNDTDVHMIPDGDFNSSLPILGQIKNTAGNCSGAFPLYNRTRQTYGPTNLLTPDMLGMIGSIAGGMPPADAQNLTHDMTTAIIPDAFSYMQVGTVATIAVNNLPVLSSEQLTSITNSDTYSSLPSTVQTSLNTEIDSTTTTTSKPNSGLKQQAFSWFTVLSLTLSTILAVSLSATAN